MLIALVVVADAGGAGGVMLLYAGACFGELVRNQSASKARLNFSKTGWGSGVQSPINSLI